MPLLIVRNDITKQKADVIVNPANEELLEGSGTSEAIYTAAGREELYAACKDFGECKLGDVVITPAFALRSKYIFHAVVPRWCGGMHGEELLLYRTYQKALLLALKNKCKSIAFPLLSSGNLHFPKKVAMRIARSAIVDFLEAQNKELLVYLVVYDNESVAVSKALLGRIAEYIDDNYVDSIDSDNELCEARNYFRNNPVGRRNDEEEQIRGLCFWLKSAALDETLKNIDESFSEKLLRIIDEKGLRDVDVYKKANISRQVFSKIRTGKTVPTKNTVLSFAIALELSLEETENLLRSVGLSLSYSSKFDLIIRCCLENKVYDVFEINEVLYKYDQPLLGA